MSVPENQAPPFRVVNHLGEVQMIAQTQGLPAGDALELMKYEELKLLREAVESLAAIVEELVEMQRGAMNHVEPIFAGMNTSDLLDAADHLATDIGSAIVEAVPEAAAENSKEFS